MEEGRARTWHFIEYHNFQFPHQGIEGLVSIARYLDAASEVGAILGARAYSKVVEPWTKGLPRKPFYMTSQIGGKDFSVQAEGEPAIVTQDGKKRETVDFVAPEGPKPVMRPLRPRALNTHQTKDTHD